MKVRTSRILLLWLAVVFLGGMLVLALTGDAEARRELPAQVAAWSTIGLVVFAGWWFKVRPRRELHQEQARWLGLRSEPGDPLGFFGRPFALLGHAAGAKDIENTSWGTWRGMEVVVIDYWFARSSDPSRNDFRYFTCASTSVPEGGRTCRSFRKGSPPASPHRWEAVGSSSSSRASIGRSKCVATILGSRTP